MVPVGRNRCHTLRPMKQWVEAVPSGWKAASPLPERSGAIADVRHADEAKAWLRRTLTEIADGTFVPRSSGRITLAEWATQWEPTTVDLAPATRNRRTSDLRNWILPAFAGRAIGSITQPEVKAWVASMTRDGANPGSIKLRYETLSRLLQAAVDAELIKRSPCYRVGLPRYEAGEMRLLTISEIVALADTIHPRYRALVLVAGTGGLRIGELGTVPRSASRIWPGGPSPSSRTLRSTTASRCWGP